MKQRKVRVRYDRALNGRWLKHWSEPGVGETITYQSLSASRYGQMMERCTSNARKLANPGYAEARSGFECFQHFVCWSREQYGYDLNDASWCLDKDILVTGNADYSPITCLFVPQEVNKFFCIGGSQKLPYPDPALPDIPFVGWSTSQQRYRVICGDKSKHFDDPYEAHAWWQVQKIAIALEFRIKYSGHVRLVGALDERMERCLGDLRHGRLTRRF